MSVNHQKSVTVSQSVSQSASQSVRASVSQAIVSHSASRRARKSIKQKSVSHESISKQVLFSQSLNQSTTGQPSCQSMSQSVTNHMFIIIFFIIVL